MANLVTGLMVPFGQWSGRSVLITGHTGFKGGWLAYWLSLMGADVHGLALDPPTDPCLFNVAGIGARLATDTRGDVRNLELTEESLRRASPEVVFHLAAQPLVRDSYIDPLTTFSTNVMGTANVLEAARGCPSVRAIVVVTTDKVYRNREWTYPYRETDELGGRDPYSASKAAAEIVTSSYRDSYFSTESTCIATARAGNVIGGGDWSPNRLVPDILRSADSGTPIVLRYPNATRPWQHVLDPLAGYLTLAERLLTGDDARLPHAWNFGPGPEGCVSVRDLTEQVVSQLGSGSVVSEADDQHSHEAGWLELDSSQARALLGWKPRLLLTEAVSLTIGWHQAWRSGADVESLMGDQIRDYQSVQ